MNARGSVFYGAVGLEKELRDAREAGDWYYGDNAYFDRCRQKFFRFTRNEFQPHAIGAPDFGRLKAVGATLFPWSSGGSHVVIVESSEHFHKLVGEPVGWLDRTLRKINSYTDRPLCVRRWRRDKGNAAAGLAEDLQGAWALVTHMSAAANEAVLAGVPAFVTGLCAATPMSAGPLSALESPRRPDGREEWAAWLAGQQWTLDELRRGVAWEALH